jgi:hypothetical protein
MLLTDPAGRDFFPSRKEKRGTEALLTLEDALGVMTQGAVTEVS